MISSMTGFARGGGAHEGLRWTWEARSVNGKGLDCRVRLPAGMEALEPDIRKQVAARFSRGTVQVSLSMSGGAAPAELCLNEAALSQVLDIARDLAARIEAAPPRLDGLLQVRGVVEAREAVLDEAAIRRRDEALLAGLEPVLDDLLAARRAEGARLKPVIDTHVRGMVALCAQAGNDAAEQGVVMRRRLKERVGELVPQIPELSEERIAQELAVLLSRADVREELDRLGTHIRTISDILKEGGLKEGGAIGRRLDFLCQECHREANTMGAKAADIPLAQTAINLRLAVETLREQVQNLE